MGEVPSFGHKRYGISKSCVALIFFAKMVVGGMIVRSELLPGLRDDCKIRVITRLTG